MRMMIYIMAMLLVFIAANFYGKPIEVYLDRVKSESNIKLRQEAMINTDRRTSALQHALIDLALSIPSADQVRIGLIHNNISSDGNAILQFDIVNSVAPIGKTANALSANLPLTNWIDFLRSLLAHQCVIVAVKDMSNSAEKSRLIDAKVVEFVTCPILNTKGQLLGAVFADWTNPLSVPINLDSTETALKQTAQTIANTLGNNP
jgi:hypothetical protein